MIRVISNLFVRLPKQTIISIPQSQVFLKPTFSFASLTDKMQKKQS